MLIISTQRKQSFRDLPRDRFQVTIFTLQVLPSLLIYPLENSESTQQQRYTTISTTCKKLKRFPIPTFTDRSIVSFSMPLITSILPSFVLPQFMVQRQPPESG